VKDPLDGLRRAIYMYADSYAPLTARQREAVDDLKSALWSSAPWGVWAALMVCSMRASERPSGRQALEDIHCVTGQLLATQFEARLGAPPAAAWQAVYAARRAA
jgi:hypothetical protein